MASPKGQKPLAFGEKSNPVVAWYFTFVHNCCIILIISHWCEWSIAFLPCKILFGKFDAAFYQEIIISSGFFAVKRRAVFILGAKWKALVRGWRRDCVVGGMETRFQWRKTHSRTAKCEAFHFAPRLFFMFLFLIPFTIRQQCIIYPQKFPTEPWFPFSRFLLILGAKKRLCRFVA